MKLLIRMLGLMVALSMLMPSSSAAGKPLPSSQIEKLLTNFPVKSDKVVNLGSGYCLDTDGKAMNGAGVRMWECANHGNQTWSVEKVDTGSFRLVNQTTQFCLDTDGSKTNGGQVRMWQCANHPNQLWEIFDLPTDQYRLKNKASGLCLETEGKKLNGGLVRMWTCTDNANQIWLLPKVTITGITKLANLASGYCLDTDGSSSGRAGTGLVRMWECGIHPNQTWSVEQVDPTYFRLVNLSSKFCLESSGDKKNGALVSMTACTNRGSQLWAIKNLPRDRYQLQNKATSFCLDTDGVKKNDGLVRMWSCIDHPNQTWVQTFRPEKVIEIQTVWIKVADDDGSNNSADIFSDDTINALIADTNAIYLADTGIKLVLQKVTTLKNTKINRLTDWSVIGCPEAEQTIQNPNPNFPDWKLSPSQNEAYKYAAANYPNQLVIYIHRKAYTAECKVIELNGGGFTHPDLNFIALSSSGQPGTLGTMFSNQTGQSSHSYLGHELGHYMGITHPMPNNWPSNQKAATAQLDTFCKNNPFSITSDLPDQVWNLDNLSDTPGDPGYYLYNQTLFNVGPNLETSTQNQCIGSGSYLVTSDVCKNYGGLSSNTFTVRPARENVMSYTSQCPYVVGNTTGETRARITPQQADVILHSLYSNRKNLLSSVAVFSMKYALPIYMLDPMPAFSPNK